MKRLLCLLFALCLLTPLVSAEVLPSDWRCTHRLQIVPAADDLLLLCDICGEGPIPLATAVPEGTPASDPASCIHTFVRAEQPFRVDYEPVTDFSRFHEQRTYYRCTCSGCGLAVEAYLPGQRGTHLYAEILSAHAGGTNQHVYMHECSICKHVAAEVLTCPLVNDMYCNLTLAQYQP